MFEPNLPAKKVNAINGLAFETVNKIYLEFDEKFWPNDWLGFSVLWDKLTELRKNLIIYGWKMFLDFINLITSKKCCVLGLRDQMQEKWKFKAMMKSKRD